MDNKRSRARGAKEASSSSSIYYREGSLLPPTRRAGLTDSPTGLVYPSQDSHHHQKRKLTIGGFFKKVSSILDNPATDSSSSSADNLDSSYSDRQRRRTKGKATAVPAPAPAAAATTTTNATTTTATATPRLSGYASTIPPTIEYSPAGRYRPLTSNNNNLNAYNNNYNNNNNEMNLHHLEVMTSSQRSCSDGSSGGRTGRKDKVKARAEAKRDQLCVGDSSMDESSNEDVARNGHSKRRSRASRTERYLKRMCNGSQKSTDDPEPFRPIDRVPRSTFEYAPAPLPPPPAAPRIVGLGIKPNGDMYPLTRYDDESTTALTTTTTNNNNNNNFYQHQGNVLGVNPLVQQTLQYFSEFDRNMAVQQKSRKSYHPGPPVVPPVVQRRHKSQIYPQDTQVRAWAQEPPKPPSRDHRSRLLLVNGAPVERYQQMLVQQMRHSMYDKENGLPRPVAYSPNTEVRNINEGVVVGGYGTISPGSPVAKLRSPVSPPRSPLKESINTTGYGGPRISSPIKKPRYPDPPSTYSPTSFKEPAVPSPPPRPSPNSRRSSKNLEEALNELEEIYNSLQLGDEELLERADRRTEEEFHYKGLTISPDPYGEDPSSSRRKTWADSAMLNHVKEEPEVPDRLRDDMAYRRMHPKERPMSVDGPSSLSTISYLMTSPVPSRRDEVDFVDPNRKPRRKEPDIALDDVVFRSRHHANNTLKIVEPQPPFGIPLGPITTGADSDYLHSVLPPPELRSPYMPNNEPDLVTDDLAFRNLRKDAQPSSNRHTPSPCFLSGSSPQHLYHPTSFDWRKKRAVRSLSANLYGMINKPNSPMSEELNAPRNFSPCLEDYYDELKTRRTSDPEIMSVHWQSNDERKGETDIRAYDKSAVARDYLSSPIRSTERSIVEERQSHNKTSSDLSSSCETPPPLPTSEPPKTVEPFTEQEISVYKKLCQDLENLVQMTKGSDEKPQVEEVKPMLLPEKEQSIEEYILETCNNLEEEQKAEVVEVSLREADKPSSPPRIKREERRRAAAEEAAKKSAMTATKDREDKERQEEEEGKDTLDEVFFRDLRLAKMSGDWKESTPCNRRGSLRSSEQAHHHHQPNQQWEGEQLQQQRCSSSSSFKDLSRLTAKCVCYITNHLTAQFFLLLVFLIVLLLAIVTVP